MPGSYLLRFWITDNEMAFTPVAYAISTLTASANFADGETVTIGGKVYTFQTVLTDVDGHVVIGPTLEASLKNLLQAINVPDGTPGTQYAFSTVQNPYVRAVSSDATTLVVRAKTPGLVGNFIATSEACANASWTGSVLAGGSGATNVAMRELIQTEQMPASIQQALLDLSDPGEPIVVVGEPPIGDPPIAVIGSPSPPNFTVAEDTPVTFDPAGTFAPGLEGAWGGTWDFGDGSAPVSGTFGNYLSHVVDHTFENPGTYTVTWTVTNEAGQTDVATLTITVTSVALVATTIEVSPATFSLNPGQTQVLSAIVRDQFGSPMSGQTINWSSGATARATVSPASGASTTVTAQSEAGAVTITASTAGGSVQDTSAGSIVVNSGGPAPNCPFVPDAVVQMQFGSALPASTSSTGPNAGAGLDANSKFTYTSTPRHYTISDPGFATSSPYVFVHEFPSGIAGGAGTGSWTLRPEPIHTYSEVHTADEFMVPGTTMEGPGSSGQQKLLGYWGVCGLAGSIYNQMVATDGSVNANGNKVASTWRYEVRQQGFSGVPGPIRSMNMGLSWQVGKRYRVEQYMKMGTNGGVDANGILRVWLTNLTDGGTTMAERLDVQYRHPDNPNTSGFYVRHWDPIWGGTGGGPLSAGYPLRVANMWMGFKGQLT